MVLSEIAVTQSDCPHVETSSRFLNLHILIMNTQFVDRRQRMFSIFHSIDKDELDRALTYFSRHRRVENFSLLSKKNGIATAFYETRPTSMFLRLGTAGFRIHPVVVHGGVERWFFISNGPDGPTSEEINDKFTHVVSLKNITQERFFQEYPSVFFELNALKVISHLSDMDLMLFKSATECGFFNWPRSTSLTALSEELSLPKSTLSYHFRMIEKKMASMLSEQLRLGKTKQHEHFHRRDRSQ